MNKMPTAKNNGGTSVKATGHDEFKPRLDYPKSLHSSCNILKTRGTGVIPIYWKTVHIRKDLSTLPKTTNRSLWLVIAVNS
jgi:hypothetical protein